MKKLRFWMALATVCGLLLSGAPLRAAESRVIDINAAGVSELTSLKGIGDAKAKAIVEHREKNGPFKSVDDLKNVSGIGDKLLAGLRSQVTVGPIAPQGAAPAPQAPASN
jgi:competence protein ComEA